MKRKNRDAWIGAGILGVLWLLTRESGLFATMRDKISIAVDKTSGQGGHAEGESPTD
jgi:hypothetical protein